MKAFPTHNEKGIALRDYFAASVIQGIVANSAFDTLEELNGAVTVAYMIADVMLEEREK
jgi:hypothetical protein